MNNFRDEIIERFGSYENFGENFEKSNRTIDEDEKNICEKEEIKKKQPRFIKLTSYRKRDVNAYISRVNEEGNVLSYKNNKYGKPATQEDLEKFYKNKLHTVLIDISKVENGCYFYKESSGEGARTRTGYLFIENGDIIIEFATWEECIEYLLNLKYEALMSVLPELEGSPKQIQWAETIRLKAIQKFIKLGYSIDNIREQLCDREASKQASKWIELRKQFDT